MESSQEKSLPATERKLQKTREDGQGARSRDLSHLAILGAGAGCLMVWTPELMEHMQRAMGQRPSLDAASAMATGSGRSVCATCAFSAAMMPAVVGSVVGMVIASLAVPACSI